MMMLECRHGKAVDLKFQKLALRYYKQPTNQVRLSPCINKAMNQKRIKAMDVRNSTPVKKWKLTCVGQCLIWSFKVSLNRSYPRNCDPCRVIGLSLDIFQLPQPINQQCFPSYRNQSIDLQCKLIDWFLYDGKYWSLLL